MGNEVQDDEYEIHPLDRDYSQPVPKARKRTGTGDGALIRLGALGFGGGFLVLLGAAITVSYASPGGSLETIGSYLHQFGMLIILGAGLSVIVAYRAPKVREMVRSGKFRAPAMKVTLGRLLLINIIVFLVVIGFSAAMTQASSPYMVYFSLTSFLSLLAAWMLVLIVWHSGILRAYAIGVLSGLVFNGILGMIAANGPFWGLRGGTILGSNLIVIQICGLLCAAYVGIVESARENANESAETDAKRTNRNQH